MDRSIPQDLIEHQKDYKEDALKEYDLFELGFFVHLLVKRSTHRSNKDKALKDLRDAKNYLSIMESKIDIETGKIIEEIQEEREGK